MSRIRDKKIDGPVSKAVPMPPHDPRFVTPSPLSPEDEAKIQAVAASNAIADAGPMGEAGDGRVHRWFPSVEAATAFDATRADLATLRDVARDLLDAHNGGFADNKAYMAVKFAALAEALG